MIVQTERMTVEEFDAFVTQPENAERLFEFIRGRMYEVVSNPYSSKIAARILGFLFAYLLQNDIGHLTGADGGYHISGERYMPDAAFISYARQPKLAYTESYNVTPPDLAVEVLSPGNDDEKMRVKVTNYLAAGTVVWVVNPPEETVEVYRPGQPVLIVKRDGTLDGGTVLPGFRLPVSDIFPQEREG